MRTRHAVAAGLLLLGIGSAPAPAPAADPAPAPLADGVRGLVTRASGPVAVDGKLDEWAGAFCTPVAYNHKDPANRASQFFYLWDDDAFYVGLRALDQKQANPSGIPGLFNGDAVEFYFDARPGDALRGKDWTAGSVHLYFTAFDKDKIGPRWTVRRGIATSDVKLDGVEIAAASDGTSYTLEFKLPWRNFPDFKPGLGALIALDSELCFGDGAARTDRTFAYGSPLSVQQPASQGKVQLVGPGPYAGKLPPAVLASEFPLWVETPWVQPERARARAVVAIPPGRAAQVGSAALRIHDLNGAPIRSIPMEIEAFDPQAANPPAFVRAVATWSIDDFAPGTFLATAEVKDKAGTPIAVVAPRLVQEANVTGR